MIHGARFPFGARFRSSMMANTIPTSNAVPINSSMNGPTGLWKYPGREGREDAVRRDRARLAAHRVRHVLVALDRVLVVQVDERRAGETARDLGEDVQRHLRPRGTHGVRPAQS